MKKRFFVTTPAYYVNDKPHIGHAYTTIAADVLARFHRIAGIETFLLTGTDEHGSNIEQVAKAQGKTPEQLCDENNLFFKDAWKSLDISFDYFIRTTDKRHEIGVQKLLEKLHQAKTPQGESVIYSGEYEGLYCVNCEKFITEKDLVNGLCPDHLKPPEKVSEKNYFFRLKAYLKEIEKLIQEDKIKIKPEERRKETLGLLKQELEDFSISRQKVTWGITLPFDPSQKAYVWVDALPNYITAIGYGDNEKEFEKWWREGRILHLIGKDILKFHCVFWPAMLLAAKEHPPDELFIHGYFTINGQKMSKTLKNVIEPKTLIEKFGVDATRYLLLTQFPFGQDGDIQEERFVEKYNSDLANDLGNLVSRVVQMLRNYSQGEIPQPAKYEKEDEEIKNLALTTPEEVFNLIEEVNINQAIDRILKVVRNANKYVESQAPWNLAKNKQSERLNTVLYTSAEVLRIISDLFFPVLPNKAIRIKKILGIKEKELQPSLERAKKWEVLKPGTPIGDLESLFPRIETKKSSKTVEKEKMLEEISIEDFAKCDLKVAKVLTAERVEGANKLLKLQIEIGDEKRQIVAGIAEHYKPEELLNKKIIVLANLKSAKIRGIESKGMLLAVKDDNGLAVLTVDKEIKTGSKIS